MGVEWKGFQNLSGRPCLQGRLEPYRIGYEEMGPCRVWLADSDTPGLSMTRAFGDAVAATVGIIAQPDLMQVSMSFTGRILRHASYFHTTLVYIIQYS